MLAAAGRQAEERFAANIAAQPAERIDLPSGSTKSSSRAGRVKHCRLATRSSQARRLWACDIGSHWVT